MKSVLHTLIALLGCGALPAAIAADVASSQPNILFIAVDDLRPELGCYGRDDIRSPNIDRIAAQGMVFNRAYCQEAVCSPTRSSLLTGARPDTTRVWDLKTHFRTALPDVVTLPQLFKDNGYFVQGMGKLYHGGFNDPQSWSVPWVNPKAPVYALPENVELNSHRPAGEPDGDGESRKPVPGEKEPYAAGEIATNRLNTRGPAFECAEVPDNTYTDGKVADLAVAALQNIAGKKAPFFLAVGLHKPHMPWNVPRKYYDLHPLESIQLPPTLENDLNDVPPAGLKMARPEGDHQAIMESGRWKDAIQGYLAAISYCDAMIGRLIDAYETSPERDNTIIVFWGDHGWHLGEKQHWRKFALWEEATRAPLIWVAPGVTTANTVCHRTVDFMTIYPTLTDLCGIATPKHVEGKSIRSLLKDPASSWDSPAITTYRFGNHAIRTEGWRLIRYQNGDEELYDELDDPHEWTNLASNPKYAKQKAELASQLTSRNQPDIGNAKSKE